MRFGGVDKPGLRGGVWVDVMKLYVLIFPETLLKEVIHMTRRFL